jgi:hypothetical protein
MLKSHHMPRTKRVGLIIADHLKDTRPETFPRLSIRMFAAILRRLPIAAIEECDCHAGNAMMTMLAQQRL